MLFNSLIFVVFFAIVYLLYLSLSHRWQNRMLLVASYVFYGAWDWRFLSLILASTIADYFCGLGIHASRDRRRRKALLLVSLTVNLGLLGFFKYYGFFTDNLQELAGLIGWNLDALTLNVILPVGISFYTFQTLSYTIDIYRGRLRPERNIFDFALFVAFFPQLVAGPIERAWRLLPQISLPRHIGLKEITDGAWLCLYGFFLKVFVADNLAPLVDRVFSMAGPVPGGEALTAVYAFAFQIFGDFAGYSSIAIGVAKLLGFDLMNNFLFPYLVTNPRDFWRNWHISLSTWLRDYLYIPLGGNRGGPTITQRNLFLTMLLGGLWHGAAWTFVLWGAYQGTTLILHRQFESRLPRLRLSGGAATAWYWLKVIFMFHVTCLGWLIFRAQSVGQVWEMLVAIFTNFTPLSWTTVYYLAMIAFYTWLVNVIQFIQRANGDVLAVAGLKGRWRWPIVTLMFYLMVVWGEYGSNEFIYFNF